jgi:hypothetical protein
MVEVNHRNRRVASHARSHVEGSFTTDPAHRDPRHAHIQDFSAEAALDWARTIHEDVAAFLALALEPIKDRQLRYRLCGGLRKLVKSNETPRVAAACQRAIRVGALELRFLRNVLKAGLEALEDSPATVVTPAVGNHENTRGPQYYNNTQTA